MTPAQAKAQAIRERLAEQVRKASDVGKPTEPPKQATSTRVVPVVDPAKQKEMEDEIRRREERMERERLQVVEWERKQAVKAAGGVAKSLTSSSSSSDNEEKVKVNAQAASEAEERKLRAEEERLARIIAKGKK